MTHLFHTKGVVEATLIELLGKLIYLELHKPKEDVVRVDLGFAEGTGVVDRSQPPVQEDVSTVKSKRG